MIYSELKNYLTQITDPDVVDLFDRASVLFERIEFEDWLDVFDNVIGDTNDEGDTMVLDTMRERLNEMLNSILNMQGVTLTEEALLSERLAIVEALSLVSVSQEKAALLTELGSSDSPQEILADVVAILSPMKNEAVLAVIDEVSDGTIAQLKALLTDTDEYALEEGLENEARVIEYAKYKIVFAQTDRWTDRFTTFSGAVGLPFDTYARLYMQQQLKQDLLLETSLAWESICITFIGIGCLSDQGAVNTPENAKPYLEQICSDLGELTSLYSKLTNLLLEFHRAQT